MTERNRSGIDERPGGQPGRPGMDRPGVLSGFGALKGGRWILLALSWSAPAAAQISPAGPPQDAPFNEPAPPGQQMTEEQARRTFAASGYPDIRELSRGGGGEWTATAIVNGRPQTVRLGRDGQVQRSD